MTFKKGQSGNPKGKRPGTRNLTTKQTKEILQKIIGKNFNQKTVSDDLKSLDPQQRLNLLLKMLQFILPRPTESNLTLGFENLSDDQLNTIIHEILN